MTRSGLPFAVTRHRLPAFVVGGLLWLVLNGAPPLLGADEALQELSTAPLWVTQVKVQSSAGYRDNVLLSAFAPVGRAFARAEAEGFLLGALGPRTELVGFAHADYLRYFSPVAGAEDEQQYTLHAEARWQGWSRLQLRLAQQAYHQDMVLDVSAAEASRVVAPLRVTGWRTQLKAAWSWLDSVTLTPAASVHGSTFRGYGGDYDEAKAGAELAWAPHPRVQWMISGAQRERRYDDRRQLTAGGRPLAGTRLGFQLTEWESRVSTRVSAGGDWELQLESGLEQTRDNGSGYFDHDRWRAGPRVTWSRGAWRAAGTYSYAQAEYLVQTVGTGLAPAARRARGRTYDLRLSYDWSDAWGAYAEAGGEDWGSNEREFAYTVNTVSVGLTWSH